MSAINPNKGNIINFMSLLIFFNAAGKVQSFIWDEPYLNIYSKGKFWDVSWGELCKSLIKSNHLPELIDKAL